MSIRFSKEQFVSPQAFAALALLSLTLGVGAGVGSQAVTAGVEFPTFRLPERAKVVDYFAAQDLSAVATRRILAFEQPVRQNLNLSAPLLENQAFLTWATARQSQGARVFIRHFLEPIKGDSRVSAGQITTYLPGGDATSAYYFFEFGETVYWQDEVQLELSGEAPAQHSVWAALIDPPRDYLTRFIPRAGLFAATRLQGDPKITVLSRPAQPPEVIELKAS